VSLQRLPSVTAAFFISNTEKAHLVAASSPPSVFQNSDAWHLHYRLGINICSWRLEIVGDHQSKPYL
jgi:hypothetical protein